MEEKSKLFYDDLVGNGYKLPDYETFKTSLQDQTKADAFYKDLSASGFKLPDFDTFYSVFKPDSVQKPIQQPVVQEQPATQEVERIPSSGIQDFIANINQTVMNIPADIADTWSIASAFTERQLAKIGVPGADPNVGAGDVGIGIPYSKITDEYRKVVGELAPVSDEFKGTFAGGVSQGLGQVAGMLLSGGGSQATQIAKMTKSVGGSLTPIVSAGKELLKNVGSRQGLIGGSMNASANYQQAINDGASEEDALRYGIENMVVGSIMENLPIQSMFSRISKIEPNAKILDVVKNGLVGAREEAVTEGFQTTYENLSAQRIYDVNREMLDGVGDASAVGGTVGFILNSAMSALVGRRARAPKQEQEVIDKAIEETQAKINTVEENTKKVEETVTALENTSERTLNNGATNLDFIENPDGSIELAEDGLSAPEAESKKLLLEAKYPNVEFQTVDNTDKSNPYAEANFTIVGIPKTNAKYSKEGQSLSKNQASFLIEGATTIDELEGLSIDNDSELQGALQEKVAQLQPVTEEQNAEPDIIPEQSTVTDQGAVEPIVAEVIPEEPASQGVDTEVQVIKNEEDFSFEESEDTQVLSSIGSSKAINKEEKEILYRQYKRGVMSAEEVYRYTTVDPLKLSKGDVDKWAKVYLNKVKGKKIDAESIPFEEVENISKLQSTTNEPLLKPKKDEKPKPEITPVEQQKEQAIEEIKSAPVDIIPQKGERVSFTVFGESVTGAKKGNDFIGDDGTIYKPSMVKDVTPVKNESEIDISKKKIKALKNSLKTQITQDKQGIIVDFEARAKDDIKFFNTLKNLVVEYSRLKGLQFNEFVADIEKMFNDKLSPKNKAYLKGLFDEAKKVNKPSRLKPAAQIKKSTEGKPSRKLDTMVNAYTELKRSLREQSKAARLGKKSEADRVKGLKATLNEFLDENKKEIDSLGIKLKTQILKKVNAINSEASLLAARNYIEKIINKHSLRKEYMEAIAKVQQAKKNIKTGKQGVVDPNANLRKLLNINPRIVPSSEIEAYNSLMDSIGARKAVLSLPEKGKLYAEVDRLLQTIEDDTTKLFELAEIYESSEKVTKVVDGVKKISFAETVDQLLEDNLITKYDAQLMKKRKTEISESSREMKESLSDAQVDKLIENILTKNIDGDPANVADRLPKPSRKYDPKENDIIRLFRSLKAQDLKDLVSKKGDKNDVSAIVQLQKVLDNIENDFIPHLSERLRTKIQANRNARNGYDILENYNGNPMEWISRSKAFIKNTFSPNSTSTLQERIKSIPTYAIDQAFRNFRDSRLYEVIFRKVAQGQEFTKSELNNMTARVESALNKIPELKQWEQMMVMGMYRLDRMSKANPNLPTLEKWIEKTLTPSGIYNKSTRNKIAEMYASLGGKDFDPKKAEKMMMPQTMELNDLLDDLYENELAPKVAVTSSLIRGKEAKYVPSYTPTPVSVVKGAKKASGRDSDLSDYINKVLNISTKGGTSEQKTGTAHALDLNPVNTFLWSAKETLLDYHMTSVYREAMQTIDSFEKLAKTEKDQEKAIDLRATFTQALQGLLMKSYSQDSFIEKFLKAMEKKAYQALLGGFTRPAVDFTSNTIYASIWKPEETKRGLDILWKYRDNAGFLSNIARFAKSTELTRMYDTVGLTSKYGDSSGSRGIKKKTAPPTGLQKILDKAKINKLENLYESFDKFNNFTTSAPDQIVARALFHGVFDTEFKAISGKELDYDKMSSGDLDYLEENFDAIQRASLEADKQVNEGFSSSNELLGVIKNQKLPSDNLLSVWYRTFDRFMTKFTIGEHITSVKAIKAMMGNGEISRTQGMQLLAAQTARMVTYQTMINTIPALVYGGILTALGYQIKSWSDEEENEEEKDEWYHELAQSLVQVAVMLGLQRNLGNVQKGLFVDPVVEAINDRYGEGITYKGKKNPYEDQITFPLYNSDPKITDDVVEDLILRTSGPASVQLRPLFDALNNNKLRKVSKSEDKKEMYSARMQMNFIQLLGSTGFVPGYRDFNNLYKRSLYDTEKKFDEEAEKRKTERKFGER